MGIQQMEAVIRESVLFKQDHNEVLQYSYKNDKHAARLIHMPISKSNDKQVAPNVKRCMQEILNVVGEDGEEKAVGVMLDYLLSNHRWKLMQKLRERRMVPKVMDEFDCASLLDESGIKIWQWRSIQQCLKLFLDIDRVCEVEDRL